MVFFIDNAPIKASLSLAEIICERRMKRCRYVKCEYIKINNSILSESVNNSANGSYFPTCFIKQEKSDFVDNPERQFFY